MYSVSTRQRLQSGGDDLNLDEGEEHRGTRARSWCWRSALTKSRANWFTASCFGKPVKGLATAYSLGTRKLLFWSPCGRDCIP